MEEQDVDGDRSHDRESQQDVSVAEEQERCYDFKGLDDVEKARIDEHRHKWMKLGHRNEGEEAIDATYEEYKA